MFDTTTDHKTGHLIAGSRLPHFLSASLVSASYGGLYRGPLGFSGWVLSPSIPISCAWPVDAGTFERHAGGSPGCVAGCTCPGFPGEEMSWCPADGNMYYCPRKPSQIGDMLTHNQDPVGGDRYNEVIIDGDVWARNLDHAIVACFGDGCEGPWPRVNFELGRGFWVGPEPPP